MSQVPNGNESYASALDRGSLDGVRIRVLRHYDPAPDSAEAVLYKESLGVLAEHGAILVDIQEIPGLDRIRYLEWSLLQHEFKLEINAYLAKTPESVSTRTLAELIDFNRANAEAVMPHFGQDIFELSEQTSEEDEPPLETLATQLKRLAGAEGIDHLLAESKCKMLVAPTSGRPFKIDLENGDAPNIKYLPRTAQLPAVSGYPHLTVPMGLANGLPLGLSFIGTAFSEAELLSAGYAFEQARP